jgi:carbohydrate kinase (thermoresistant glucokinase family)
MTTAPPGPIVVVMMGVSGSGKTTVGTALARRLGWTFQEGDDFHPPDNITKMAAGHPLTDADRVPWLARVEAWIAGQLAAGRSGVIACSALKRAYRDRIVGGRAEVRLAYLEGSPDLIAQRLERRRGHFMPPALLASQLADLQPPALDEAAILVDIGDPIDIQVDHVVRALDVVHRSL